MSSGSLDRGDRRALALVLAVALGAGLFGLRWGLPGPSRRQAFPPLDAAGAQRLKQQWEALYSRIQQSHQELDKTEPAAYIKGLVETRPGWTFPPDSLLNSCRSFLLQADNPDEKKAFIILGRMRPWKLDFEPLYLQYGGAFTYSLGAFLELLSLGRVVRLVPDMTHYLLHPADMAGLYLAGRCFVLLFSVGTALMLFAIGRRLSGWPTGLLAAVFFTLTPTSASFSHLAKPHLFATFWALAAVWALLRAWDDGSRKYYLLCGACAGISAGGMLPLVALGALPLALWLGRRGDGLAGPREWRLALQGSALSAAVCILLNPYVLLRPRDFLWELTVYAPQGVAPLSLADVLQLARSMSIGVGVALSVLSAVAVLDALRRDGRRRWLSLIVFFVCAWLFFKCTRGETNTMVLRVYLTFIGIGCVLAADLLMRLPKAARALLILAVLAESGLSTAVLLENMRLDGGPGSTRSRAAAWIEANVPAGASVGLMRLPEPAHVPPFRYDRYRLVVFDSFAVLPRGKRPDYLVLDDINVGALAGAAERDWTLVKRFAPYRLGPVRMRETSSIANPNFYVYRRNAA